MPASSPMATGTTMDDNRTSEVFAGTQAVYALTPAAAERALFYLGRTESARAFISASARAAEKLPETVADRVELLTPGSFGRTVADNWKLFDAHLFIMATGIVVRRITGLLEGKTRDPAVVVCDEKGDFAISLLSGHIGGANRLARRVAAVFGGRAVITTATDVQGLAAIDEIAARKGFRIINPQAIKAINSLILARRTVGVMGPSFWTRQLVEVFDERVTVISDPATADRFRSLAGLVRVDSAIDAAGRLPEGIDLPVLELASPVLVAGIGCRRGVPLAEIEEVLKSVLEAHGLLLEQVVGIASIDLKKDEAGLLDLARKLSLPLVFFAASELEKIKVPSPSARVAEATGSPSVCEAAALAAAGGELVVRKSKFSRVTVALAARPYAKD